jgi:hypothetical protein
MSDQSDAEKKKAADLARDGSPEARRILIIVVGVIVLASLVYSISGVFGYRGKVPFVAQSSANGGSDSQMSAHPLLPTAVNPPQTTSPAKSAAPATPATPATPANGTTAPAPAAPPAPPAAPK